MSSILFSNPTAPSFVRMFPTFWNNHATVHSPYSNLLPLHLHSELPHIHSIDQTDATTQDFISSPGNFQHMPPFSMDKVFAPVKDQTLHLVLDPSFSRTYHLSPASSIYPFLLDHRCHHTNSSISYLWKRGSREMRQRVAERQRDFINPCKLPSYWPISLLPYIADHLKHVSIAVLRPTSAHTLSKSDNFPPLPPLLLQSKLPSSLAWITSVNQLMLPLPLHSVLQITPRSIL